VVTTGTELPKLPPPGSPAVPVWPGEHVTAGRYRLFVRRTPSPPGAERAVFVHGLGGASTNWTDLMYLLAPRLAGEALDLPGFGWSDPPPDRDYRLGAHVRATVAYLETTGRGPVHLFGNSLGGAVCIRLAATRPDLVRTLTLVSPALPSLRPERPGDSQLLLLLLPGVDGIARRRLSRVDPETRARAVLDSCFHDLSRVPAGRLAEAAREVARREELHWTADALLGSLRGLVAGYLRRGPGGLWACAARISAPTLLVWGRHDRLVSVRLAARANAVIRNSRLVVIEDGGHVSQLEHPQQVAQAVMDMLSTAENAETPGGSPGVSAGTSVT